MITLGSIFINQHSSLNEVRKKVFTIVKLLSEETIVATRVATAISEMCRPLYKLSIIFEIEFDLNTTINHSALWLNFTANQSLPGINLLTPFFDQVHSLTLENNLYRVQAMLSLHDQQNFSNDAIAKIQSIIQQKSRNELMTELEDKNRELYKSLEDLKLTTLMKETLQEQNLRMGAELNVSRMLQQMILPKPEELVIEKLDIVGFMESADEVGGDYYDVL